MLPTTPRLERLSRRVAARHKHLQRAIVAATVAQHRCRVADTAYAVALDAWYQTLQAVLADAPPAPRGAAE
jgi:hypothetical protein